MFFSVRNFFRGKIRILFFIFVSYFLFIAALSFLYKHTVPLYMYPVATIILTVMMCMMEIFLTGELLYARDFIIMLAIFVSIIVELGMIFYLDKIYTYIINNGIWLFDPIYTLYLVSIIVGVLLIVFLWKYIQMFIYLSMASVSDGETVFFNTYEFNSINYDTVPVGYSFFQSIRSYSSQNRLQDGSLFLFRKLLPLNNNTMGHGRLRFFLEQIDFINTFKQDSHYLIFYLMSFALINGIFIVIFFASVNLLNKLGWTDVISSYFIYLIVLTTFYGVSVVYFVRNFLRHDVRELIVGTTYNPFERYDELFYIFAMDINNNIRSTTTREIFHKLKTHIDKLNKKLNTLISISVPIMFSAYIVLAHTLVKKSFKSKTVYNIEIKCNYGKCPDVEVYKRKALNELD